MPCDAAQPYPRKRPYPNPLDSSDCSADYDRDSLHSIEEYTAWARHPGHSLTDAGMWYSDGLQASQDTDPTDGCRGIAAYDLAMPVDLGFTLPIGVTWTMPNAYKRSLDLNGDGCLTDEERDEDGDLLSNYDELSGRMVPGYWKAKYPDEVGGTPYENGLDWLDPDSDGDGTIDGLDDQDFDDYLNIEELDARHPERHGDGRRPAAEPGRHAGPQHQRRPDRRQGPEVPGGHHRPVGQPVQPLLPRHGLAELRPGAPHRPGLDHRGPGGQEPVAGPEWPAAAEPPDRAPALTQGRISSATPASSGRRAFGGRTSPPGGLPVV